MRRVLQRQHELELRVAKLELKLRKRDLKDSERKFRHAQRKFRSLSGFVEDSDCESSFTSHSDIASSDVRLKAFEHIASLLSHSLPVSSQRAILRLLQVHMFPEQHAAAAGSRGSSRGGEGGGVFGGGRSYASNASGLTDIYCARCGQRR